MIALLALVAAPVLAADAGVQSETVLQLRHDFYGDPLVPAWELLSFDAAAAGQQFEGYLGLEWANGLGDDLDPDLYALTVRGDAGALGWTVGRQQVVTHRRLQSLDGGRLDAGLGDHVVLSAWGGYARHQDLDDFADGTGMGRLEATFRGGPLFARLGGWVEDGSDGLINRQDATVRAAFDKVRTAPAIGAMASYAEGNTIDGSGALELARVELSATPAGSVRTTLHAQHREAVDPDALMGAAILDAFAPDGVDEVGVGLRAPTARWAALSASWAMSTFTTNGEEMYGHTVQATWLPARSDSMVRLSPGYRFQAGPGGMYHAGIATVMLDVTDDTEVTVRAAAVPYRKLHDPWDLAIDGRLAVSQRIIKQFAAAAMVEAARDANFARDLRGGLVLTVEVP